MSDHIAYKILRAEELAQLRAHGIFHGSTADLADGYIHLSTAAQLAGTLEKHFSNIDGLILATVNLSRLGPAIRWESARGGQLFPHLYAPLTMHAVRAVTPVEYLPDGTVALPKP